jgi:anti-sigma factor RsiW
MSDPHSGPTGGLTGGSSGGAIGAPIGEDDLQAFIDGRLPEARRAQIETYLAENQEVRDRVLLDRAYRDSLRAKLASKFVEPLPPRLRIANIRSARREAASRRVRMVAAALALFVAGIVSGWMSASMLRGNATPNTATATIEDNATTAYRIFVVEVAHPVEVAATQEEHLLHWLSKRLGRRLVAPDLSKFGYQLIGGRLLSANQGAAAQLMYENSSHQRLTIYVQAESGSETAFRFRQAGDASTFAWIDQGFGFAVTARAGREQLLPIAEAVYHALLQDSGDAPGNAKG